MTKKIMALLLIFISFCACANTPNTLEKTANLLAKRASLMEKVAAYKWYNAPNNQATAYSATQEQAVLLSAQQTAQKLKITPLSLMLFSQIQMDLSKQIEAYWITYWNAPTTPPADKPTSATIISLNRLRNQIQKIDLKLYPMLQQDIPYFKSHNIKTIQTQLNTAFDSMQGIPTKPSYLALLAASLKQID